jgi:hypothetical protein
MFISELEDLMLTSGHDLSLIGSPLLLDVSEVGESFLRMNGELQLVRHRDLLLRDAADILSTVVYGPDLRTRLTPTTTDALYSTYAPAGVHKEGASPGTEPGSWA